jgi:capsular exopolysaccharide synthesis family protein
MNTNTKNHNNTVSRKQEISLGEIVDFVWRLRYWILLSVLITVSAAFIYVRLLTPMYERTTWVKLNRENEKSNELYLLPEYTNQSSKKNDNELFSEIFVLKSPTTISKVVTQLGINTRYFQFTNPIFRRQTKACSLLNFRKTEYYDNSPFELSIAGNPLYPEGMLPNSIAIEFKDVEGKQFQIRKFTVDGKKFEYSKEPFAYGDSIPFGAFSLVLRLHGKTGSTKDCGKYLCTWRSSLSTASYIAKNLEASVQGKNKTQSDIIVITYRDNIPRRAEDILNTLVRVVNDDSRDYKNNATQSAISFIDQRLAVISSELGAAETDYKNYQSSRIAVDLESQTQLAVRGDMDYQKQLTEVQLQLRILDMISGYLAEAAPGEYKVIPANVGVSDAGLVNIIDNYNNLVTERNRMIANSSETNPRVISTQHQLADSKNAIGLSINNLLNVYRIREKELQRALGNSQRKMAEIPQQQFELQQLSRRMEVIEPLFQMLQQKREETQMIMYSSVDELRVIESAFGSSSPLYPNNGMIMLFAFFLGCCIPPAYVLLKNSINNKVMTKHDIMERIDAPLIATLPNNENRNYALIPQNGHDSSSEAFRMLRSNIQYLDGVKVIQVTSSVFGEGKSYVASNLALSIAYTGRKVILVGMDLRKPALYKIFPGVRPKPKNNVVGFLTGKCVKLGFAIENSGVCDTLDVLMSGPVPPNPTEILSFDKQKELIEKLRERYDYVIIDSAPYLLVSDSLLINPYVDATLFMIRAGFTDMRLFGEINEAINSKYKPIKNAYVVLNGLNVASNKFRFDYGKDYGYSNDYGYSLPQMK